MCVKFVYRVLNEQWSSFTVRSCTNVRVHTDKSCWKSFSSLAASLSSFEAGLVMLNHASPYTQVALLRWWWWCLHQIGAVCKIYVVFGIVSDMFITNIYMRICVYILWIKLCLCVLCGSCIISLWCFMWKANLPPSSLLFLQNNFEPILAGKPLIINSSKCSQIGPHLDSFESSNH